jgi:hypothetical protein
VPVSSSMSPARFVAICDSLSVERAGCRPGWKTSRRRCMISSLSFTTQSGLRRDRLRYSLCCRRLPPLSEMYTKPCVLETARELVRNGGYDDPVLAVNLTCCARSCGPICCCACVCDYQASSLLTSKQNTPKVSIGTRTAARSLTRPAMTPT